MDIFKKDKKPKVYIVGAGMGNRDSLTLEALKVLESSEIIIGAQRLVEDLPEDFTSQRIALIKPKEICEFIQENNGFKCISVIMSGDTGFYSGAKKLYPLLKEKGYKVVLIPGICSVQYMASKMGINWHDTRLVSAHGRECNIIGNILSAEDVFFLTGGESTVNMILKEIYEWGIPGCTIYVGERFSYSDEKITKIGSRSIKKYLDWKFDSLSCVRVVRETKDKAFSFLNTGIPDELFIRNKTPMTKQAVRAVAISKLGIEEGDVLYDIGAGTGSVSVEMALLSPMNKVFAIETEGVAYELIQVNKAKFSAYNIKAIKGRAPEALEDLPSPNAAFIGGSKGSIYEILLALKEKNNGVRVVITAIALETLSRTMDSLKSLAFENIQVTQVMVGNSKSIGDYNMLMAENPIFIISAGGIDL